MGKRDDAFAEVARIMAMPAISLDMSGSMEAPGAAMGPPAWGGTEFRTIPPQDGGGIDLSALFARLETHRPPLPKGNLVVFTDGEPSIDLKPIADRMRGMPESTPSFAVRLDHSGSTPDGKPLREGFWFSPEQPDLPVPRTDVDWPARDRFVSRLETLEKQASRHRFRGSSPCRVCGCRNGSETLSLGAWQWPSGLMHYLRDHGVRPSPAFEAFVDGAFIRLR